MFRQSKPWLGELETPDEIQAVNEAESTDWMQFEWEADTSYEGTVEEWRNDRIC